MRGRHESDDTEPGVVEVVAFVIADAPALEHVERGAWRCPETRGRIRGRIGERHAEMQILAALQKHRAGEPGHVDSQSLQLEACTGAPVASRLGPCDVSHWSVEA